MADPKLGIGGAPTRATTLPDDTAGRKKYPVGSGFMDYFPDAICEVSRVSWNGNEQHNPGQPLHWARGKSMDHPDTMQRHYLQRGTRDTDGQRHTAKMVWRALAMLQQEIEDDSMKENHDTVDQISAPNVDHQWGEPEAICRYSRTGGHHWVPRHTDSKNVLDHFVCMLCERCEAGSGAGEGSREGCAES